MARPVTLRQIEVFKALIEHGTVSRAAEMVAISQPAASKLLISLERDAALTLFDRRKGRLTPTPQALRLYEEVDRIFAGVRQVDTAIAVLHREDQGRLDIGVLPAFAGAFIQEATMSFLRRNPRVFCSIQSLGSRWISESILTRKLDVGLVTTRVDHPDLATESLLEHPLLCIMPPGHPLARLKVVRPHDLNDVPFVSFSNESYTAQRIASMFEAHEVRARIVLTASVNTTVCQFVAAGLGVSLVHPLFIAGMEKSVVVRPFEPTMSFDFLLCFSRNARSPSLVSDFVQETKSTAERLLAKLNRGRPSRAASRG